MVFEFVLENFILLYNLLRFIGHIKKCEARFKTDGVRQRVASKKKHKRKKPFNTSSFNTCY